MFKKKEKFETKIERNSRIKEEYLSKLTKELISEGFFNKEISEIILEISSSLDQYLLDRDVKTISELEQGFGNPSYFIEEYKKDLSKSGVQLQKLTTLGGLLALLIVPAFFISTFYISPFSELLTGNGMAYTDHAFSSISFLGYVPPNVIFSIGYGIFGLLLGLNVFLTLLLKISNQKLSTYDSRRKIIKIILGEYWLIVINWLILVLVTYIQSSYTFEKSLNDGFSFIIVESIVKWALLGVFLITTAVYYTLRYRKVVENIDRKEISKFVAIFTIITIFMLPVPGFGLVFIVIGTGLLLSDKITGKIWFLGTGSILIHLSNYVELIFSMPIDTHQISAPFYENFTQIIFGIPLISGFAEQSHLEQPFIIGLVAIILVLLAWIIFGFRSLKKNRKKILPNIRFKAVLKKKFALFLLLIVILATLGSRPHSTITYKDSNHLYEDYIASSEITVFIPKASKVYIQVYGLYGNCTWDLYAYSSTATYEHWSGNISEEELLFTARNSGDIIHGRSIVFDVVEPMYLLLTGERPIVIEIPDVTLPNTLALTGLWIEVEWRALIPWFPYWTDLIAIFLTFLSLFLEWSIPEDIKKQENLVPKKHPKPKERV